MIKLSHISQTFQTAKGPFKALDNVSVDIPTGEIFGIIGRSGAGKSTLVRCINLLQKPDEGTVTVDGTELTALDEKALQSARARIGMIFQHFNLLDSCNVFDNIALPLALTKTPKQKIKTKVTELLKLVGLSDKRLHYPDDLSGGQKQRVAIARALASDPSILLCDEATSALDPETTLSILNLLKDINQKLKLTIVVITHEMSVIKFFCDRALVMEKGRTVECASVLEIFTQATHPVTKAILQNESKTKLPRRLQERIAAQGENKATPILKLCFIGTQVEQPILSNLHDRYGVDVNILQAHVDWIQETEIGISICELLGSENQVEQALASLKAQDIIVEGLGYV